MRTSKHLEAGDSIYLIETTSSDCKILEIVLKDDHINDRSKTEPVFVYKHLRLKSAEIFENNEVKLEQGEFYDNSVGMRLDFGYGFFDSDVKCFTTLESAERYLALEETKLEELKPHYFATMKAVDEHLGALKDLIRGHERFVKDHKIPEHVARKLDYYTLDELSEFFFSIQMFE